MHFTLAASGRARVTGLDEDALAWKTSKVPLKHIQALSFARLRFRGDPGHPAGASELSRQATALGHAIVDPSQTEAFGLLPTSPGSTDVPCIESIRSARRVGPDRQVLFDIVAEISQRCIVKDPGKDRASVFYSGSTVILGPQGEIRYVIGKGAGSKTTRMESQREFMLGERGKVYWDERDHVLHPRSDLLQLLHAPHPPPPRPSPRGQGSPPIG